MRRESVVGNAILLSLLFPPSPFLDAHLQSCSTEIKYDCRQETWIFVRTIANYEGIPRRWDLEAERAN